MAYGSNRILQHNVTGFLSVLSTRRVTVFRNNYDNVTFQMTRIGEKARTNRRNKHENLS